MRREAGCDRPAVSVCVMRPMCSRLLLPLAKPYPRFLRRPYHRLAAACDGAWIPFPTWQRPAPGWRTSTEGPRSRRSGPIAVGKAPAMAPKPPAALAAQGEIACLPSGCGREAKIRHGTEIAATRAPQGSSGEPAGVPREPDEALRAVSSEGRPGRHGTGPRAAERRPRDPSHPRRPGRRGRNGACATFKLEAATHTDNFVPLGAMMKLEGSQNGHPWRMSGTRLAC